MHHDVDLRLGADGFRQDGVILVAVAWREPDSSVGEFDARVLAEGLTSAREAAVALNIEGLQPHGPALEWPELRGHVDGREFAVTLLGAIGDGRDLVDRDRSEGGSRVEGLGPDGMALGRRVAFPRRRGRACRDRHVESRRWRRLAGPERAVQCGEIAHCAPIHGDG